MATPCTSCGRTCPSSGPFLISLACVLLSCLPWQSRGLTLTHTYMCVQQYQQYQSLMVFRQLWVAALNHSWGTQPPPTNCPEGQPLPTPDHCSWQGVTCVICNPSPSPVASSGGRCINGEQFVALFWEESTFLRKHG